MTCVYDVLYLVLALTVLTWLSAVNREEARSYQATGLFGMFRRRPTAATAAPNPYRL